MNKVTLFFGCLTMLLLSSCDREMGHSAASSKYEPQVEEAWALMTEGKYAECHAYIDKEFASLEAKARVEEKAVPGFFPEMTPNYGYHELDGAGNLLRVKQEAFKQQKKLDEAVPVWEKMFREFPHFQSWRVPERKWHPAQDARIDWLKYQFLRAAKTGQWDSYQIRQDCIFDGVAVQWAMQGAGQELLNARDFKTLEAAYHALITLPQFQGIWDSEASSYFLGGAAQFDPEFGDFPDGRWVALKKKLDQWAAAIGDSVLARLALADYWVGYAWKARGMGTIDTVTPEGLRLFRERLAKARQMLESTPRTLPAWYSIRMVVCRGGNTDAITTKAFGAEGAQKFPWYAPLHIETLVYLLPRWHGGDGEWQQFCRDAGNKFGPEYGTFLAMNGLYKEGPDAVRHASFDWATLRKGFESRLKTTPYDLWAENEFALFAWLFEDKAAAKALFGKIGHKPHPGVWEGLEDEYAQAKAWVEK